MRLWEGNRTANHLLVTDLKAMSNVPRIFTLRV